MTGAQARPYPSDREADIALRDGRTLHVRPVRADDADGIRLFLERLSPESTVFRFFGVPNVAWVVSWSTDVDYDDTFALVAETGTDPQIVAHAAYVRSGPTRAEVAFMVADSLQGHGISTALLAHLAAIANERGITTFTADVMPSNHRMIDMFRASGFPISVSASPDSVEIEMPTSVTEAARSRFEERDRRAAVAAVSSFLEPRSVAVVGASRHRGTISGEVLHNIVASGFVGPVYAVNPSARTVQGHTAYPTVSAIPDSIDLAVVVVPAERVVDVARDCAQARVRGLLVISSGFAEVGGAGRARQATLLEVCRGAGIRLVGPNCLGVINTSTDVRLNATFAPRAALPGSIGFMSQSGGLGIAIIEAAARLELGLSSFVAVGNKADLSGNDMLSYWEQDDHTAVALLYLESFGNPRKFARVAPRFARKKPLLAVKSGRSAAGARATRSHTGALLSGSDNTVDALFGQAGVIRTDTLHELFGVAQLLTSQPLPRGDRVAIVTNAGGPGIMCADACQADGVDVPEFAPSVRERLRSMLPDGASVDNPIDLLADSSPAAYSRTMNTLIEADACDAILTIFVPSLTADADQVAAAIRGVAERHPPVPIAAVFMTEEPPPVQLRSGDVRVPGYEFPEDAARSVALAARHGRWRAQPEPTYRHFPESQPEHAAMLVSQQLTDGAEWFSSERVAELFECYGLPQIGSADTPADSAVEIVVGVVNDSNFGPVIACGPGGMLGELVKDIAIRLTPLSERDVKEMLRSLKTYPLLTAAAGASRDEGADLGALEDLVLRLSAIVEAHPEIVELECDPVQVHSGGVSIGAAKVRVEPTPAPAPMPSIQAH